MAHSLRTKALRAISWTFAEAVGLRFTQFTVQIILARLLEVEEFGLIAMLAIFMAIAQSLLDSGFGAALIQKNDADQMDKCSIFYFNLAIGVVVAGGLCLGAPLIAQFYEQPLLIPLTRLMSLIVVINAFAVIQNTVLTKEMDFKTTTQASMAASILSGGIGITLAVYRFGPASLVAQQIFYALVRTLLLWFLNTWRPALIFSFSRLRRMFGFGSRVIASGLLNTIFSNIYYLTIGKLFSASALGYFRQARRLQELPTMTLSWTVGRVAFPVFARIQQEPERLKRGLKAALTSLAFLNFPVMLGIGVTAGTLIPVLLTDKWTPSIPYLRLLCIEGLLFPMSWFNANVLYAIGRSDLCFRLEIVKKVLIVVSIAITWQWGILAIILGQIVVSVLSYLLNGYYNGVLLGYSIKDQLYDLLPYMIAPAVMAFVVYLVGNIPLAQVWVLVLQVISGVAVFVCISAVLRIEKFMETWELGRSKLRMVCRNAK